MHPVRNLAQLVALPKFVLTIDPMANLATAYALMRRHHIHHLVVIDGDNPVGVVADRDVFEKGMADNGHSFDPSLKVRDVMRLANAPVPEYASVSEALDRMWQAGVSAVPIVDSDGQLTGIITEADLLRGLAGAFCRETAQERALSRCRNFLANPVVQGAARLLGEAGV